MIATPGMNGIEGRRERKPGSSSIGFGVSSLEISILYSWVISFDSSNSAGFSSK
jgi:hypothetical protein